MNISPNNTDSLPHNNLATPSLQLHISPGLGHWLQQTGVSLAFTTYQTNRLMMVGSKADGKVTINERIFDKPMGLFAEQDKLYMSTRYQIWQFNNLLAAGERYQEGDRLYVPSLSYTTGNLNVHDVVLDGEGNLLFVNTDFSCLASLEAGYSFKPLWQPPFISKLAAEDRCHLNGLAMVAGKPTYMTACSATNNGASWREHRHNGGIVLHLPSNEIIADNLSMPHSPRWYQGKLWLLNSGTGELGYLEQGQFTPITFCPGFVRGLAFWQDYAFVGLSKLRSSSFTGLTLEIRLQEMGQTPQCGLMVIDLRTGEIVHSLLMEGAVEELFDVVVLPGVLRPRALGFHDEDIERLVTFPDSKGLITTKPTVKRPSLGPTPAIAGLPNVERLELERKLAEEPPKFQRVYHLNPESLLPYDAMTFPSLRERWRTQPQRGELVGVSASVLGEMVGFAIAEFLPNAMVEIISLFVEPAYRDQKIGTKMMAFLERELVRQQCQQVFLRYVPTERTEKSLEPMLKRLGWEESKGEEVKLARKLLLGNPPGKGLEGNPNPPKSLLRQAQSIALKRETLTPESSVENQQVTSEDQAVQLKFQEGKSLAKENDWEGAIAYYQEALKLQPDYIPAYNQLGNALQLLGRTEEAIAVYQKILEINPNVAATHCNLGRIWQLQGKTEAAITAYQKAIELKPDLIMAYHYLGDLFNQQQAINHDVINDGIAEKIKILVTLILGYLELGFNEMAQQYFQQLEAILLQPNLKLQESEAKLLYHYLIFSLPYLRDHIDLNGHLSKWIARSYCELCLTPFKVEKSANIAPKSSQQSEPLRIGIISKYLRRHSVGWCSRGIIKAWSQLTPDLYLYLTGNDYYDDLTEEFRQMTEHFFDLSQLSDLDRLEKLRADNLDILIDLDSLMNSSHALILYNAPAKAVFSWLGCEPPYISENNYYLCDRHTHPLTVQPYYQEQLIRMPDFAVAIAEFPGPIIDREAMRKSLNIAENNLVYLSVASGKKINPESIKAQISILKQVPDSILIYKGYCDQEMVRSLYQQECLQMDIDPERCRFIARQKSEEEHRTFYQIADIALDTYPYNGGTHNLESLWFNLPIVTFCGEQATARMGYSFLQAVGISKGVARSWEDYIDWGIKLGTDANLRHQLQEKLRQSKQQETLSPLWNPEKFATDAYRIFQTLAQKESLPSSASTIPPVNNATLALFNAGKEQSKANNLEKAIAYYQEALKLQPDYIPAYNQLGNALQLLGRTEEAIACYQKILAINPQVAAVYCNLGSIWQLQGKTEKAIAAYQNAIELKPDFTLAYRNLGNLYATCQQFQRAEIVLRKLLQLQSESAENHQAFGNVLRQLGRTEEAITCFQNAIKCDRHFVDGYQNLGCLLMMVGNMKLAQNCFQKVLRLDPQNALGYNNLGHALEAQGELAEALKAYRYALELKPDATDICYQFEHLRLTLCDWENYDQRMAEFQTRLQRHVSDRSLPRLAPLSLNSFPVPLSLHQALNGHWAIAVTQSMTELKTLCQFSYPIPPNPKIRIGYLSADFRNHAVGSLICSLFQYHNRSDFEVYAYSLANTEDEVTEQFKQGCDLFREIATLTVEAAAKRIHADNIQILIDLAGYTSLCRSEILALQPAPIQIQYLGYPDTMAAEFIQYILADRTLIPPELAPHYSETVLEIPHAFVTSPLTISDQVPTRFELGLSEEDFVYCCFNRTDKFDPHLFTRWLTILRQVPNSVLWLAEASPEITQTLRQAAQTQGINPQRLVFLGKLPWSEFVAIGQRADLFLDTFLYNAGATAICALQAGLPILTCPGESFASRMGASICMAAGLEALICDSPQQYEEQAIYWGTHPDELGKIRDRLIAEKEQLPLFQPQQWIQNVETVLQKLWQNYLAFHHSPERTFTVTEGKTINGGVIFSSHSSQQSSKQIEQKGRLEAHPTDSLSRTGISPVQTEGIPKIRFVCATRVSQTNFFTETGLGRSLAKVNPPHCELYLFPENTQGLPTLYNRVIEASVTDPAILVFVHDDVHLLDPHWHTKLLKALTVYELVGIAGNKRRLPQQPSWYFMDQEFTPDRPENLSGQVFSLLTDPEKPDSQTLVSHLYGQLFQSVKLLDGLFLAGSSQTFLNHHLRFEEQFDFHFYDLDLSRQAEQNGLKVGTWPIAVIHDSGGNYHSTAWRKAYAQYLQTWELKAALQPTWELQILSPVTPSSLATYQTFTFPSLQKHWQTKPQRGQLMAIAALQGNQVLGLLVAEQWEETQAEILSFWVIPEQRHQGIGTALLKTLQQTLTKTAIKHLCINYCVSDLTERALEPLLAHLGWRSPQCTFILAKTDTEHISQAPWLQKRSLSEDFSLFPWTDLIDYENTQPFVRAAQAIAGLNYPSDLSPLSDLERLEPLNSLGLRYQDRVVGWMITHRIDAETIRYSTLFVEPTFRFKARGIILLSQAILKQIASPVENYVFGVAENNQVMLRFLRRHLQPYLTWTSESRRSELTIP